MQTVNIHDAKTHLSRYVEMAAQGEEIILARAGRPVARLVQLNPAHTPRTLGLGSGLATIPANFDTLCSDEIETGFSGSP